MGRSTPLFQGFSSKVKHGDLDDCWLWTGCRTRYNQGQIWLNGKMVTAYRVAWELQCGPIPPGLLVCHTCDNPLCVNPSHLFLGTHKDNQSDAARKGRKVRGQRQPGSKLTESAVRSIRHSLGLGTPKALIAREFGVHPRTIAPIANGENWGWLQ